MKRESIVVSLEIAANYLQSDLRRALAVYNTLLAKIPYFPDALYGSYKVFLKSGDIEQAKQRLKLALLVLGISATYNPKHREIFYIWMEEFRKISKEPLYVSLTKRVDFQLKQQLRAMIKKGDYRGVVSTVGNFGVDEEMLYLYFMAFKEVDAENALYLAFNIGFYSKNVAVLKEVIKFFTKSNLVYPAILVAEKVNRLEVKKENLFHTAVLYHKLQYDLERAVVLLRDAIALDRGYTEAISLLLSIYKALNDLVNFEKTYSEYVVKDERFGEFFEFIGEFESDELIFRCVREVLHSNDIYKIEALYQYSIVYGRYDLAQESLDKIVKLQGGGKKPSIKNDFVRKKSQDFENVVALYSIGRSGSFFFHSLIDGHKEVATYPGVFFQGFFNELVFKNIYHRNHKILVENFLNIYKAAFDASISDRVPGNPLGEGIAIGEGSGLTTLGENRDTIFKVDTEVLRDLLLGYLRHYNYITDVEFFKVLHMAFEDLRGHNLNEKKVIFYHIHNPPLLAQMKYRYSFSNPMDLIIIRNWLQSLESWLYNSFPAGKLQSDEYHEKMNTFFEHYFKLYGKLMSRLFSIRERLFFSKSVAFVKLEDVKNAPEATMRAVAEWMGIEYDECLLRPEFMGLKFHSNKSKLNPTISEFDKKSIERKVGVLFSEKDALLLNTVLKPWNEVFEYGAGEFGYVSVEQALKMNEEVMDWERRLIDFFEIKEEDALKVIKYRKQKLQLALNTQEQVFEELKKVELIRPKG